MRGGGFDQQKRDAFLLAERLNFGEVFHRFVQQRADTDGIGTQLPDSSM